VVSSGIRVSSVNGIEIIASDSDSGIGEAEDEPDIPDEDSVDSVLSPLSALPFSWLDPDSGREVVGSSGSEELLRSIDASDSGSNVDDPIIPLEVVLKGDPVSSVDSGSGFEVVEESPPGNEEVSKFVVDPVTKSSGVKVDEIAELESVDPRFISSVFSSCGPVVVTEKLSSVETGANEEGSTGLAEEDSGESGTWVASALSASGRNAEDNSVTDSVDGVMIPISISGLEEDSKMNSGALSVDSSTLFSNSVFDEEVVDDDSCWNSVEDSISGTGELDSLEMDEVSGIDSVDWTPVCDSTSGLEGLDDSGTDSTFPPSVGSIFSDSGADSVDAPPCELFSDSGTAPGIAGRDSSPSGILFSEDSEADSGSDSSGSPPVGLGFSKSGRVPGDGVVKPISGKSGSIGEPIGSPELHS
jgi:hypothetical protein